MCDGAAMYTSLLSIFNFFYYYCQQVTLVEGTLIDYIVVNMIVYLAGH